MKNIKVSDQILIENYLGGDESSFETLLLKYKDRVYTQLYLMVKNRDLAEDLFQETFIKVVNTLKMGKYNHEGKFLPWVKRIAHNLAIDHFRKMKKRNEMFNVNWGKICTPVVMVAKDGKIRKILCSNTA